MERAHNWMGLCKPATSDDFIATFRFTGMRFEQRNSAWIETVSARSATEVSSLVVLNGHVRRGGKDCQIWRNDSRMRSLVRQEITQAWDKRYPNISVHNSCMGSLCSYSASPLSRQVESWRYISAPFCLTCGLPGARNRFLVGWKSSSTGLPRAVPSGPAVGGVMTNLGSSAFEVFSVFTEGCSLLGSANLTSVLCLKGQHLVTPNSTIFRARSCNSPIQLKSCC